MEILLIDIGALALFLGYIAIVYWHGINHEARPAGREACRRDSVGLTHAMPQRTDVTSVEECTIAVSPGRPTSVVPRARPAGIP